MKILQLIAVFAMIFVPATMQGQSKLPESTRESANYYIYKIGKDNLREIHLKEKSVKEEMLGEFVAEFPKGSRWPNLPRGNYMVVNARGDQLNYSEYVVDYIYFKVAPAEELMLCLHDSLGNLIDDATVKCGSRRLKFDKNTHTYNAKSAKNEQVLEVENKGVYHYIEIEKNGGYYVAPRHNAGKNMWSGFKRFWSNLFNGPVYGTQQKYTGFVVFSKPRYKPGETVKLKAYMAELDGKPYNKPVDLRLVGNYPSRIDTLLTHLEPYRPGMYEYEFELSDKLNMTLDASYNIQLRTDKKKHNTIGDRFRYEDYELKGIRFTMDTDKTEYAAGDSVKLKFNITNENELQVYDGTIELKVTSRPISMSEIRDISSGFVPDSLWTYTVSLEEIPNREIILPDSIFPKGVSFPYQVSATYLSADNEKKTAQKYLNRNAEDYTIDFSLKKGILTITELLNGISQPVMADISVDGEDGETIKSMSVSLPYSMPLPWYAADVTVKTEHETDYYFIEDIEDDQIGCQFYRQNDSVYLKVDNPAGIPFWYTVYRNKKAIARGYTTNLDYAIKDNDDGYNMQLSYLLGEGRKSITRNLPFVQKNISMNVSTPTTVYPGQKTDVEITVTDNKGKPVGDVDITAYSFTSKFDEGYLPNIAVRGKAKYARDFRNPDYDADENTAAGTVNLKWDHWKGIMALDSIGYYNFLYPETYYVYTEPTPGWKTLLSPYVVLDGVLQMVHMLWIDNRLYYTSAAQQMDVYTFPVEPGNHYLRFRTADREITVSNVYVKRGHRNIFSFNVGKPSMILASMDTVFDRPLIVSVQQLKKKEKVFPTDDEKKLLSDQLITVDNNFGTIKLPGYHNLLEIPAYIKSGDIYYYINHQMRQHYNYTLRGQVSTPVVLGPFPKRSVVNGMGDVASVHSDQNHFLAMTQLEGGNRYTFYPGYQKIKSWNAAPFRQDTRIRMNARNFREMPLTPDRILEHSKSQILTIMKEIPGRAEVKSRDENQNQPMARLELQLGKDVEKKYLAPVLILVVPKDKKEIARYQLYYGGTRNFRNLPIGEMDITLVFDDSTSYTRSMTLHGGGQNFMKLDSITYDTESEIAATAFAIFNRGVTKTFTSNPFADRNAKDSVVTVAQQKPTRKLKRDLPAGTISGIVSDQSGEPLIGVTVLLAGTTIGAITDLDGYYELKGVTPGDEIMFAYIGYNTQTVDYTGGNEVDIQLQEDEQRLDEVVVVAYGTQRKSSITGSVININETLAGRVPGLQTDEFWIRGISTYQSGSPLVLINGVPYEGNVSDLDQSTILSFNVLKDASATAIYGSRAANGVIMIQTNDAGNKPANAKTDIDFPVMEAGNTMRRNFHDDAFWQPRLRTNEQGKASFEVTYPDDITSWNAYFVAIGNKKQADKRQMTIKSFKPIEATLSAPRFVVRGDSLNAVGRITNHIGDSISVKRTIEANGQTNEENLELTNSHVDYIPATAQAGDSLTIAYSIRLANDYFDGEERSVPIIEQGMEQTHGEFRVLNDTVSWTFTPDAGLGTVTVHAQASSLEMFLKEIEKVDSYPYYCNEQMASKIKVLLAKKRIAGMFGLEFKEDKKIRNLISRLNNNKNNEGRWGWWNKSSTEVWISNQVISAFLDAEEAGYKTGLDKEELMFDLTTELKTALDNLKFTTPDKVPHAKRELMNRLITLKRLDAPVEYNQYFEQIETLLPGKTVADKLKTMETLAVIGQKDKINVDSLMHYSRKTMLGSMFWGEEKEPGSYYGYFMLPYNNNTDNSLLGYKILRAMGGHEKEMEQIRNYFFERRQGQSWANTYESSRIIETIMPDMLIPEETFAEVKMTLNGREISKFPFTEEIGIHQPVQISKEGTAPVFVTVYQQAWNPAPEPESAKGFTLSTVFTASGDTISHLTAGKVAQLQVLVTVDAEAEYVQIEVPIPAGCSYESKRTGNYWKEVHREHFKDKVVIFSNKLSKGEHRFTIDLLPRFTGKYSLNPAKAELMYFPVFYGNDELKTVGIQ